MIASRKRKADEDDYSYSRHTPSSPQDSASEYDVRMSASPTHSPSLQARSLSTPNRSIKRMRPSGFGRPLPLPRLLETLDAEALRTVIRAVSERHPEIVSELVSLAPRPTVSSALDVLNKYESAFQSAFPFGGKNGSDYTYNRVKTALGELLSSLSDFTPHFLPPQELQTSTSLEFLDYATNMIHRLPLWDNPLHNHHRQLAYEEMSKAWVSVISEALKKGGGIQLEYGGWDAKISQHNQKSGGRMQNAVDELNASLGLPPAVSSTGLAPGDPLLSQLSRDYSSGMTVRVGTW